MRSIRSTQRLREQGKGLSLEKNYPIVDFRSGSPYFSVVVMAASETKLPGFESQRLIVLTTNDAIKAQNAFFFFEFHDMIATITFSDIVSSLVFSSFQRHAKYSRKSLQELKFKSHHHIDSFSSACLHSVFWMWP